MNKQRQQTEIEQNSTKYLHKLLQNKSKNTNKAHQYISIKNVSIQQQLIHGIQQISEKKQNLVFNIVDHSQGVTQKKRLKQIQNEKFKIQKKLQLIQSQIKSSDHQSLKKVVSQEQRLKFTRQKAKQRKILCQRRQQSQAQIQRRQALLLKKQQQQQQKLQQEIKQKRLQQSKKRLSQIQARKLQRALQNKKSNQLLKQKSKQKTLAEKIQQTYTSSQNILLQQRKKKLAQLRQFHKPMDRSELNQHAKKLEMAHIQKSRKKEFQKSNSTDKANIYYRSMFHQIIQREKKEQKFKQVEEVQNLKQLKQRAKKYADEVKINYKPEIDQKKKLQVQKRVKSSASFEQKSLETKFKGLQYLDYTKQYALKHKKAVPAPVQDTALISSGNRTQAIDYLTSMRNKNQQSRIKRSVSSAQYFIQNLQKKNISGKERQNKIIQFAQDLERKAKAKEGLKGKDQVDEEVDKLYLQAIEIKLRALDG